MFRLLLILVLFLFGCEKDKIPTSISTQLASDNEALHFPDGISIGNDQNNIKIGIVGSDGIGMNLLTLYSNNSLMVILGSDDRAGFLRVFDRLSSAEVFIDSRSIMLIDSKGNHKVELSNDGILRINGVQVLGSQQPAIANSDGSQADNARAINELLEAFRKHGSIDRENQIALSEN